MIHECSEQYKQIIKQAESLITKHEAIMDTMLVKIKDEYFSYQPELAKANKKQYVGAKNERIEEIQKVCDEAEKFLKDNCIEMLICFVSLKEGGAAVFISGDAVKKYKTKVFDKLQEIEEKHNAQISRH